MTTKKNLVERYLEKRGVDLNIKNNQTGLVLTKEITDIYSVRESGKELVDLVNVIEHNGASGKYEVLKFEEEYLSELQSEDFSNNEVANLSKKYISTQFEHKIFSGRLTLSTEKLEDGDYNLDDLLSKKITQMCRKTRNFEIGKILKEAPEKNVSSIDELKDIINDLNPDRHNTLVLSKSLFKLLDKEKSTDGSYIVKINKKEQSSENLYVDEVLVVSDEIIGETGDKVAFVGDLYNFVTLFDRNKNSLRWLDNSLIYGMSLMLYTRFVVKKVETDCAYYLKWN